MTYKRSDWAIAFLNSIGNAHPTWLTIDWVINWTDAEGPTVGGQGAYNLLNTTQDAPGATAFNHFGPGGKYSVKNYTSFSQGISANAAALQNGYYPSLLQALKTNDVKSLGYGQNSPSQSILNELNTWCGSCGYGRTFVLTPANNFLLQQFQGSTSGTTTTPPSSTSTSSSSSTDSSSSSSDGSTSTTPTDWITSLMSALGLPTQQDVQNFIQQFIVIFIGGMILLIGIVVLLFSRQGEEQHG